MREDMRLRFTFRKVLDDLLCVVVSQVAKKESGRCKDWR